MTAALHLVAHVGRRGVLFDVRDVDSVVDLPALLPAPGAAPAVRGLVALRSRIATVLATDVLLGDPAGDRASDATSRAVVTQVDGHLYAFVVDTLEEVADFAVEPAPSGVTWRGNLATVSAIAEGDAETLVVLDVGRLVARALDGAAAERR